MRLTPAQIHLQKAQAAELAKVLKEADTPHGVVVANSGYELMLAQLAEHQRSLKSVRSREDKASTKAEYVENYMGWVEGVLESGNGEPDEVFITVLIWCVDAGQYSRALDMAAYAIKYEMDTPHYFTRTLPEFLMEEYSNAAISQKMATDEALQYLPRVLEMTEGHDAFDEIKAKLHKAYGFALVGRLNHSTIETSTLDAQAGAKALTLLMRAYQLHEGVGVKKDIEKLERWLKKEAPQLLETLALPAPAAAHSQSEAT